MPLELSSPASVHHIAGPSTSSASSWFFHPFPLSLSQISASAVLKLASLTLKRSVSLALKRCRSVETHIPFLKIQGVSNFGCLFVGCKTLCSQPAKNGPTAATKKKEVSDESSDESSDDSEDDDETLAKVTAQKACSVAKKGSSVAIKKADTSSSRSKKSSESEDEFQNPQHRAGKLASVNY
ncbi:nucleolin 1-like [Pyrus ussuriensis x Pyrus communis]|uniref:Nucleolin 1-like n=1 Tax=Pyrus ussuriensis x Pyrus communis TaxID=2448454 RepID=A0A5N5GX61_9ROSA|nr:nucleolin 1-like [Pyrus ussuriensis x Pyrus communis]